MTDPTEPGSHDQSSGPDADHAAVSAYVDGVATDDEVARVEADPTLLGRAERYRAIGERVRDVPAPPPGAVDDHVAAALDAFAAEPATGSATDRGTLVDLDERRARWRRIPLGAVAAAAAVLLVVVGAIGLLGSIDGGGTDTATRAVGDDATAATEASPDADAFQAAPVPGTIEGRRVGFGSVDELATYLEAQTTAGGGVAGGSDTATDGAGSQDGSVQEDAAAPTTSTTAATPTPATDAIDPCDAVSLLDVDPTEVVAILPALVDGRPVTAVVHVADGADRLVVVDDTTCQVTTDRPL